MDIKLFFNNQQSIKLSYDIAESFRNRISTLQQAS